jgi:hypothetical protein
MLLVINSWCWTTVSRCPPWHRRYVLLIARVGENPEVRMGVILYAEAGQVTAIVNTSHVKYLVVAEDGCPQLNSKTVTCFRMSGASL